MFQLQAYSQAIILKSIYDNFKMSFYIILMNIQLTIPVPVALAADEHNGRKKALACATEVCARCNNNAANKLVNNK